MKMRKEFGINKFSKVNLFITKSLIFLLIINSGTTLIYGFNLGYLFPILLVLVLFVNKSFFNFNPKVFYLFLFLILCQFYYFLAFKNSISTQIIFLLRISSVSLIIYFTKNKFPFIFVKMIYFISIISIFFWVGIQISPNLFGLLKNIGDFLPYYSGSDVFFETHNMGRTSVHLWLYNLTFNDNMLFRNYGIFYEPGMFSFYLILSLIFSLFSLGYNLKSKIVVVQIITLLTTFSTSGYIALLILIIYYSFKTSRNFSNYVIITVFFFIVGYYVINLEFILQKTVSQASSTEESSRFYAIVYHFDLLKDNFLMGFGNNPPKLRLSPNGISIFILRYGIISFIFSLFLLTRTFKSSFLKKFQDVRTQLLSLIVILIVSFSQTITTMDFYFSIMLLNIFIPQKKEI